MWDTPLGGPPRGPWGPPQGTQVSQSSEKNCKNSKKIYKKLTCIKIPQIITQTSIFGHLGHLGGPLGGQNGFWAGQGGFSEVRALVFFSKCLVLVHYKVLGG